MSVFGGGFGWFGGGFGWFGVFQWTQFYEGLGEIKPPFH